MSIQLDKDEYVVYEARRNWVVLWNKSLGLIFSILIPIVIFSLVSSFDAISFGGDEKVLLMIFVMSWIFIVWNFLFVLWTDHYLDILVITNKRLIDIEQKGMFVRDIAVVKLSNVEDVTTLITGLVATVVGYGDLKIQSAGTDNEFVMKNINNPVLVRSKIREAISGEVSKEETE